MRKKRQNYLSIVASLVAILLSCSVGLAQTHSSDLIDSLSNSVKIISSDELLADFRDGKEQTSVIVIVRSSSETADHVAGAGGQANLQTEIGKQLVRSAVSTSIKAVVDQLDAAEITVTRKFTYLAGFAATVTPEGLEQIVNLPDVVSVEKNRILEPHLAQGIPLMNAASVRSTYTGSGISIAICDTGVDTSHPRLGNGGSPIFNSKVIGGYDTGDNDNDPRPSSGDAHGTACAGIAAGDTGTVGDYIGGVAPDAKLYAIKIAGPDPSTQATTAAMIAGWEWPITHQNDDPTHPILIISTSFGGGRYTSVSSCEARTPAMTTAAANAVAAGITIFASSGNEGYCDSMGWPACISHVNSVGAVYDASFGTYYPCVDAASCAPKNSHWSCSSGWYATDATSPDMVTSYSNSASFLDIFAPANQAYTADIVGSGGSGSGDYNPSFGGTSAACPYAAGAAAVLQHAAKTKNGSYLTPVQVKQYLVDNGDNITDGKVAVTKPRVNLGNAVAAISGTTPGTTSSLPFLQLILDGSTTSSCPAIPNGDFESGAVSWAQNSLLGFTLIGQWVTETAHSGTWYTWLGRADNETAYIQQQVTVPSSCPNLVFYHWIRSSDVCGYDYGYVRINGANVLPLPIQLCTPNNTGGWVKETINLGGYANQNVTLQIRAETDGLFISDWFIDDVAFQP